MKEELLFYWLSKAGHIGAKTYEVITDSYGSLEEAFTEIKRGRYLKVKGFGEAVFQRLRLLTEEALLQEELGKLSDRGIGYTYLSKGDYPVGLKNIYSVPVGLFYRGRLPSRKERLIAVVGSRAPSERGLYHGSKLSKELSEAGVGIVSGMALGIDSAAHMGSLDGGGPTFAVLGSGPDVCYPKTNFSLYLRIIENGGILSEYPPGTEAIKTNFPERNRIISGLSDGILVVEAREKSGSLITANMGLDQGKNIYAVPGDADFPLSGGTNKLIQLGAKLVMRSRDILEDFSFFLPESRERCGENFGLSGMDSLVHSVLGLEPRHISAITEETGLTEAELFVILLKLELKGAVKRVGFEYYVGVV